MKIVRYIRTSAFGDLGTLGVAVETPRGWVFLPNAVGEKVNPEPAVYREACLPEWVGYPDGCRAEWLI